MEIIKRNFLKLGIDKTIFITIITRFIQACGGVLSIVVIAKYLTPDEQGYFYTFASIIAIQVFFELGLTNIITQYAAHEYVHLTWNEDGSLEGESIYKSRLASILHFCVKWFGVISLSLFAVLVIAGILFFKNYHSHANANINWQLPWVLLCVATSVNLFIDPVLAFYEGLGDVKDMARLRLIQKTLFLVFLFVFLFAGFKLYASPLASLLSTLVNYFQIAFSKRFKLLKAIWRELSVERVHYFEEIFPYQWRIALSWISGFFIFQLFNPVLFATQGAVVAGQMGMTLQALSGVAALSMSWISTKIPLLSSYIAKKDYLSLDTLFDSALKQLTKVNLAALVVFVSFVAVVRYLHLPLADRFLPLIPLVMLCSVTFVNQFSFSWATYLRCHKQEPFLINSIVVGVLCMLSTVILGKYFGLYGVVIGYTSIVLFMAFPWCYYIFKTKKAEWHK